MFVRNQQHKISPPKAEMITLKWYGKALWQKKCKKTSPSGVSQVEILLRSSYNIKEPSNHSSDKHHGPRSRFQ